METNFNFKSQICTSREQSERLLALGLKKETADMALVPLMEYDDCTAQEYFTGIYVPRIKEDVERYNLDYIPAWSLHRLLSLIEYDDGFVDISIHEGRYGIHYGYDDEWYDNLYDAVISCIEALIEEKDFNKEYLV